jgi:uncharacterized membrane protein YccC
MSAYHQAFWAFVGTTGPIIALANVLTFNDATYAVARLRRNDRKSAPEDREPASVLGKDRVRAEFFRILRLGHIYFVGLCFALSLTLTLLAAFALWQRTDIIAGPWVIVLIIITFTLLFILGACSAAFKRRLEDLQRISGAGGDGGGSVDAMPSI